MKVVNKPQDTEILTQFNMIKNAFPELVKEENDRKYIEVIETGCILSWREFVPNSQLMERFMMRVSLFRHIPYQMSPDFKIEHKMEYNDNGVVRLTKPDYAIIDSSGEKPLISAIGEIGICNDTTELALDNAIYFKLNENLERILRPEGLAELSDTFKFQVNIFNPEIFFSTKTSYESYIDSDTTEESYYTAFLKFGIASFDFTLTKVWAVNLANRLGTNGITIDAIKNLNLFDLNTKDSSLFYLYIPGVQVGSNQYYNPTDTNFSVFFDRNKASSFNFLSLPLRNNGRGGSLFDNIRGMSSEKVLRLVKEILTGHIERLTKIQFNYSSKDNSNETLEIEIVGWQPRSIKGSAPKTIVIKTPNYKMVNGVQEIENYNVSIIGTDISIDNSQHSTDAIAIIVYALTDRNVSDDEKRTFIEKATGLSTEFDDYELEVLTDYIKHVKPKIDVALYYNATNGIDESIINQNADQQSVRAKEILSFKPQFRLLGSALNGLQTNVHFTSGAGAHQDRKNHITAIKVKTIEEHTPLIVGYKTFKEKTKEGTITNNTSKLRDIRMSTTNNNQLEYIYTDESIQTLINLVKQGLESKEGKGNYKYIPEWFIKTTLEQKNYKILMKVFEDAKEATSYPFQNKVWAPVYKKYMKMTRKNPIVAELFKSFDKVLGDEFEDERVSNAKIDKMISKVINLGSDIDAELFLSYSEIDTIIKGVTTDNTINTGIVGAILGYLDTINKTDILVKLDKQYIIEIVEQLDSNLTDNKVDIETLKSLLTYKQISTKSVSDLVGVFNGIIDPVLRQSVRVPLPEISISKIS